MTNKDCRKPRETHKKPSKATTASHRLLKRIGTRSPAIVETKTKTAIIKILLSSIMARETKADGLRLLITREIEEAIAGRTTGTEIKLMTVTIGRTSKDRIRYGTIVTKVVVMITIIGIGIQASGGAGTIDAIEVKEGIGGVGQGRGTEETEETEEIEEIEVTEVTEVIEVIEVTEGTEVMKEEVGQGKKVET